MYGNKLNVTMVGIIDKVKIFRGEQENNWAILSIEDFDGIFDAYVYKKEYKEFMNLLVNKKFILIHGYCTLNKKEEKIIIIKRIEELLDKHHNSLSEFHVYLKENELDNNSLKSLKSEFNNSNGELSIFFHIKEKGEETVIRAMNIKAPKSESICENFTNKYKFIKKIKIL